MRLSLAAVALAAALGITAAMGADDPSGTDPCAAATYQWRDSVPAYGVRDYAVRFCGDSTLDAYAGAEWKGNKNISVVLIEPDGTMHMFKGSRQAGGELEGPLDAGEYRLVVRNGEPSQTSFKAELSFE